LEVGISSGNQALTRWAFARSWQTGASDRITAPALPVALQVVVRQIVVPYSKGVSWGKLFGLGSQADLSIGEGCSQKNVSRAADGLQEKEFGLQKNSS
jgi:hypothetical protein